MLCSLIIAHVRTIYNLLGATHIRLLVMPNMRGVQECYLGPFIIVINNYRNLSRCPTHLIISLPILRGKRGHGIDAQKRKPYLLSGFPEGGTCGTCGPAQMTTYMKSECHKNHQL